jgi:tetratricopeptide (TPR) repeat protein
MIRRLAIIGVILISIGAMAQLRTPGPGQAIQRTINLKVRVLLPNDRPAGRALAVSVMKTQGSVVAQSFTDDNGNIDFHNMGAGIYKLRVEGNEVETTDSNPFELSSLENTHYEYLHVQPKADDKNNQSGNSTGGMVSAADLNIPDKARKEFEKGAAALQNNEPNSALEHFQKATRAYPPYADAYNNIGVVEMKLGHPAEARQAFETAVNVNPKAAGGYVNLARMDLGAKEYTRADELLTKALTLEPNRLDAIVLDAQTKLLLHDPDAVIALAKKAHAVPDHKQFAAVHLICGRAYEQKQQADEAIAEYQLFLTESPQSPTAPKVREDIARLTPGK